MNWYKLAHKVYQSREVIKRMKDLGMIVAPYNKQAKKVTNPINNQSSSVHDSHPQEDIPTGTLGATLRELGITWREFERGKLIVPIPVPTDIHPKEEVVPEYQKQQWWIDQQKLTPTGGSTMNWYKKAKKVPGGKADGKKPSDFDPKEMEMGKKIEMEHTNDKGLAEDISMDHLEEFPDYYTELDKMEKKLKKKK